MPPRGPETADEALDCDYWLKVNRPGEFWLIHDFARCADGPTLELGCGAGRISQSLAREGVRVVGLELSEPMLARAQERRERAGEPIVSRLRYEHGDMRNFKLEERFGLVVVPFATFWRHLDSDTAIRCLRCIKDALIPDGMFLIDAPGMGHPNPESFWEDASQFLGFSCAHISYATQKYHRSEMMIGRFS